MEVFVVIKGEREARVVHVTRAEDALAISKLADALSAIDDGAPPPRPPLRLASRSR